MAYSEGNHKSYWLPIGGSPGRSHRFPFAGLGLLDTIRGWFSSDSAPAQPSATEVQQAQTAAGGQFAMILAVAAAGSFFLFRSRLKKKAA